MNFSVLRPLIVKFCMTSQVVENVWLGKAVDVGSIGNIQSFIGFNCSTVVQQLPILLNPPPN